ncbi:MAG: Flp family type IVb pilin [Alphaproteobacteria bacterium]|nr:Flp family type IVb pilin [Alphaproteobacteria bacterium]MCB9690835.1 Flp family type IVb pilin [Alphaproteobacteria bacterium]
MRTENPVRLSPFLRDEDGATAIEYGLIASLVAIVLVAGIMVLRSAMLTMYSSITGTVDGAMTSG